MSKKPHAVLVPFPSQGHINPFLKLAKLLHQKGFYITFINNEYNHKRLIKSKGSNYLKNLPDFDFQTISDGLPDDSPDIDVTQDIRALCRSMREFSSDPFKNLLLKINDSSKSPSVVVVPPVSCVSCVIADGLMSFALKAAQELGIAYVPFWTFGACGFMSLKLCADLKERGIIPFKDSSYLTDGTLDSTVDWIPGLKNFQLKHMASLIQTTDDFMLELVKGEIEATSKASAVILYTFDALERDMLQILSTFFPPIYSIGPLQLLVDQIPNKTLQFLDCSLWESEQQQQCAQWLDSKDENSVLYVNFGSIAVMTEAEILELAWGLAGTKLNFCWIIRPDLLKGGSGSLPPDFLDEIKERGLILSWCDQEKILNHSSVGAFLTHCGWNSTMEGITAGVLFVCMPRGTEQGTNSKFICEEWGIGVELGNNCGRYEIARVVRELVDGEESKKMKKRAMEWKCKAVEAVSMPEGSGFVNLERLVDEVLLPKTDDLTS